MNQLREKMIVRQIRLWDGVTGKWRTEKVEVELSAQQNKDESSFIYAIRDLFEDGRTGAIEARIHLDTMLSGASDRGRFGMVFCLPRKKEEGNQQ